MKKETIAVLDAVIKIPDANDKTNKYKYRLLPAFSILIKINLFKAYLTFNNNLLKSQYISAFSIQSSKKIS